MSEGIETVNQPHIDPYELTQPVVVEESPDLRVSISVQIIPPPGSETPP